MGSEARYHLWSLVKVVGCLVSVFQETEPAGYRHGGLEGAVPRVHPTGGLARVMQVFPGAVLRPNCFSFGKPQSLL